MQECEYRWEGCLANSTMAVTLVAGEAEGLFGRRGHFVTGFNHSLPAGVGPTPLRARLRSARPPAAFDVVFWC